MDMVSIKSQQHVDDEIQKLRTKTNPLELGWMKTQ
jgi:hypothetical protein